MVLLTVVIIFDNNSKPALPWLAWCANPDMLIPSSPQASQVKSVYRKFVQQSEQSISQLLGADN